MSSTSRGLALLTFEAESHDDALRWALADPADPAASVGEEQRASDQAEYAIGDRPIRDERIRRRARAG